MDLIAFRDMCAIRLPIAVVLTLSDFRQLERAYDAQEGQKIRTHYFGAPILHTEFRQSYILVDEADTPTIHFVP